MSGNLDNVSETWNAGAERLYGYSAAEAIGRQLTECIVPPDQWADLMRARERLAQGELLPPVDTVNVTKDGRRIDVSVSRFPIKDQQGQVVGRSSIVHDITARKREEKRLALEHAVTKCIAIAEDVSSGLTAIMQAICAAEAWESGSYWQVDAAAGVLRFGGYWNTPGIALDAYAQQSRNDIFGPGVGVVGRVWQTQQPLWISDAATDPRVVNRELACQTGLGCVFAIPVVDAETVIGVLAFMSSQVRAPDERLLVATRSIGSQVGQFLQRKQAEEALQSSRDQFRKLVENGPLSMALVSRSGVIEYINRKAIETFGYLAQDIPNMDRWWALAYPDEAYRAEVVAQWSELVADAVAHNHEIEQREYRVTCKDGSVKLVAIQGAWVAGKVLVVFVDVTESRRAQHELALALDRFRFLAESARVYAWIRRLDTDFATYLSPPDALLGPRPASGNYPLLRELVHADDRAAYDATTAKAIAELGEFERELHITRTDGEVRWLLVRGKCYREETDNATVLAGVTVDITERKHAEEEIRRINRNLERRVRERTAELNRTINTLQTEVESRRQAEAAALSLAERLQSMARRLGDAQEIERRRLAADVHDGVCSNLAAIGLNLELLQRQLAKADTAGMKSRLTDLISHVDYAQAAAKNIAVDLRPLLQNGRDLHSALADYAEMFQRSTGIKVDIRGSGTAKQMPATHKVALFRIAQEALTNCAKHARAQAVAVDLNHCQDHAELRVSDDGVGFDLGSVNQTSRGLGLLSMQERTAAIGGIWHIESAPGNGTRVTIRVEAASSA